VADASAANAMSPQNDLNIIPSDKHRRELPMTEPAPKGA
jgi:hypothetical protein